ncbi:MAG: hypothetical protein WCX23_01665 [Candidatus Paceibacterota bacterium]|jgi:hypothetical protein|nr:hypothetical protein [Candidatus Paceibacterota bacterium]
MKKNLIKFFSVSPKRKVEKPKDFEFPYLPKDKEIKKLGKIKKPEFLLG